MVVEVSESLAKLPVLFVVLADNPGGDLVFKHLASNDYTSYGKYNK